MSEGTSMPTGVALRDPREQLFVAAERVLVRDGAAALSDATRMIAVYLSAERDEGRITADADVGTLALMLTGSGHLLFAGSDGSPPSVRSLRRVVSSVLAGVLA